MLKCTEVAHCNDYISGNCKCDMMSTEMQDVYKRNPHYKHCFATNVELVISPAYLMQEATAKAQG